MFKKTKIAAVTAAVLGVSGMAIAPSAQAVSVNDAGATGQVLVFPYYNVNNGFITSFNITNTTDQYKAVKVRFRESKTSNDVLDFNVYMSPNDMWTMGLSADADGGVRLTSDDKTCTHPKFPEGGVAFRGAGIYDSVDNAAEKEGYLEVIEMGVVSTNATVAIGDEDVKIAEGGLLHVDGTPKNCDVVELAWQQGKFVQGGAASNGAGGDIHTVDPKANGYPNNAALGGVVTASADGFYGLAPDAATFNVGAIFPPSGGLTGSGILLDLINVAGFVYEPVSVVDYSTVAQHYLSSDENFYLLPSLASGDVADAVNVKDDSPISLATTSWNPVVRDIGLDDSGVLPRTSVPSGINPFPMAHAMAVTSISNQYILTNDAKTDWVTAAPMKKHGIFNDYRYVAGPNTDTLVAGDIAIADNSEVNGYWKFLDAGDVKAAFNYFDREEGQDTPDVAAGDFSPPLPTGTVDANVPFPNEVNILALSPAGGTPGSVLGSNNAQGLELATGFTTGWGTFDFSSYNLADTRYTDWDGIAASTADATKGVPLAGFVAVQGGVGAGNLGETFPHVLGRTR